MQIPSSARYYATFTDNKTQTNPDRGVGHMYCHVGWNDSTNKGRSPRGIPFPVDAGLPLPEMPDNIWQR